ncbi:MAG: nicotinate (nicotinamide) nucleotide adenylyltransferase [Gammaproteobacteria bacterium]|nr:nicotinate (nicotinamide) nucleotide adenylyltransferase [Gammaproteobacteria bacterium]
MSARPPHKSSTSASVDHRFGMLQAALAPYPNYLADDREISRQEKSYTFDTVLAFRQQYPHQPLYLIIGADSLPQLPTWYRYQELLEQVHLLVMARPGYDLQIPDFLQGRLVDSMENLAQRSSPGLAIFEKTAYDISATRIREILTDTALPPTLPVLQKLLPTPVIDYIQKQQSYKISTMNPTQIKDQIVAALEDIKGVDIRVIDIADISDFADFMVVASGTSDTHVKALAREASDRLRKQGLIPLNEDGADIGEWVLVDFGDVVLHVMRPEVRDYYDLEKLWDEDVRELLKQHRELQES